jgi:putative nucleotidyltransferase with HDIG domain
MRIHVYKLEVGDRLIHDIFNGIGLNILSAGTRMDAHDIEKLIKHDIDYVDIFPRSSLDGEVYTGQSPSNDKEKPAAAFADAIEGIKALFESASIGEIVDEHVEASFTPLISSFKQEKDVVSLLISLNSKDDYTYQHSVQVGMLSYYIAKWLGKVEQEAHYIGKAGYLHDIGKSKVPSSILQKPGRLTNEEFDEIKQHTLYGYDIIQKSIGDEALAIAALEHHERIDGKGYPHQKTDREIHPIAKIIAVADVYSAMICNRVYQKKRDLLIVLKELHRLSFGEIDAEAAHAFIKNMIPNFIGKKVTMTDGRSGTIIMTNSNDFFRPLVQIEEQFVDLSQQRHLDIENIFM